MSLEVPLEDFVFVTMEEFETYLHRDLTEGSTDPDTDLPTDTQADEAAAALALTSACQIVLDYVGDIRMRIEDEILVDGYGTEAIVLPEMPVWRVNSVEVDDEELVEEDDWRLGENSGVLYRMVYVWPWGRARIRINFDHGYVFPAEEEDDDAAFAEPVPQSLKLAAMAVASRILSSARQVNIGMGVLTGPTSAGSELPPYLRQYVTEGATFTWGTESFTTKLSELEKGVLAKFRAKGGRPFYRAPAIGVS